MTLLCLGGLAAAVVRPALADISPPPTSIPTTTSGPSPDAAPTPTATKKKTSTPAPKPRPTTSKPAPTPRPVHTSAPVSQPAPRPSSTPAPASTVQRPARKAIKPAHHAKKKATAKRLDKARRQPRRVVKPQVKHQGVLAARAAKPATQVTRDASPASSDPNRSSGGGPRALVILLFALPALVLGAAFLPPRAVPYRMAIVWRDSRLNVGLLAAAVLVVEALLYLLIT